MNEWFSPLELAALQLPGLPGTKRGINDLVKRYDWRATLGAWRKRSGGGYEYHVSILPEPARRELETRRNREAAKQALAVTAAQQQRQIEAVPATALTARQRQVMEARAAILLELDHRIMVGLSGVNAAIAGLLKDAESGALPEALQHHIAIANDRSGGETALSRRTILRWRTARETGGTLALAPKLTKVEDAEPSWFALFLSFYAKPTKPTIARALVNMGRDNPAMNLPSYRQVRTALGKLGEVEKMRGRMGQQAIRTLQAYRSRDTSDLLPTSVYAADGKTFDSEVAHPRHGGPFKPEITTILDVFSRRIVGWSAGLSETTLGVMDALRHACCNAGIPAIFYSDRGPGYKNKAMDAPLTGFLSRLNISPMRAIAYNSQAKGNIERLNRLWSEVATDLPTFIAPGRMDKQIATRVHKQTRRDIALTGSSRLLMPWAEFLELIDREAEDYNNRPHSGLPRISDPETGRRRFMTPNEMWAEGLARGFEPMPVSREESDDLFRPWEIRTVQRCIISLYTNDYFALELEEYHGREVIVAYDIHDATRVWVREIDRLNGERQPGRLIAIAEFGGNKTRYVPVSFERQAMEQRAKGRKRRLEAHIVEADRELNPAAVLEYQPVQPVIDIAPQPVPEPVPVAARAEAKVETALTSTGRPASVASSDAAWALWVTANPDKVLPSDAAYARELLKWESTKDLLRSQGVDLDALRSLARSAA